ncbi:regulatory P domain-containing protein [Natronococcus sp. A-GB7]|uniref:LVIVD repeat-containing protein n=1 Tax=Natronococcus sp. A-GB7 TaxID=3037649 RepID=UPI00241CCD3E|nr:regulatory P domain-containing protein [Natronococcus sp. A-GB7]MDG5818667.1 regulatory P domain-containing protein [Natronococcus sp. A-GB7]
MSDTPRRTLLKRIGIAGLTTAAVGTGTAAGRGPNHNTPNTPGQANARTRGRTDLLGHELPEGEKPRYTFGTTSPDGMWGGVSSFPSSTGTSGSDSNVVATLYDLSDLENPTVAHELEWPEENYRSNHMRFDGTRDGLYYVTHERDDDSLEPLGMSVVDFGWEEGTPEDPEVLATVDAPNTGSHTNAEHPEDTVIYMIDKASSEPGVIPVDVDDPENPVRHDAAGPDGYCHALEVDPIRDVLHCAYIGGDFVGYVILDISKDSLHPEEIGRFDYDDHPDYTEVGEPGFEDCHQAHFDPNRDIAIVGDELFGELPGGKHVFDIGWGEGSLDDPRPISHFYSPDAREQDVGVWTTHFHDILTDGDETLLVDGGYSQGFWVANITDPENPVATERFATDLELDRADTRHSPGTAPYNWSAVWNDEREFAFSSDTITGAYTFSVDARPARGKDGGGPGSHYDLEKILERFS